MQKAQFEINGNIFSIEFKNSPTAQYVYKKLPIAGNVQRWGDEIFFDIPFIDIPKDDSTTQYLEEGDIALWTKGSALAIFFGPTPESHEDQIYSPDPVVVIGKVLGDLAKLKDTVEGDFIFINPEV